MSKIKDTLLHAASGAGGVITRRFRGGLQIDHKEGVNNLVTDADREAETVIIDTIRAAFPDHAVISEEAGTIDTSSPYRWIIDPIDGTVNFSQGIPLCCVSIALQFEGEVIMGAVYSPLMDELFFAEKGKGALLNDRPVKVSERNDFGAACLVTGFPYHWPGPDEHPVSVFERFVLKGLPVRRLGSAAIDLCWVACGRFDGFWEYNLNAWDVAAGKLIVEEAGGLVTDFDGNKADIFGARILATNGLIHEDMRSLILNRK